jgi:putative hydrolase of the HAD superfamily
VLDLDDTLFLERDYVKSGFAAVESWVNAHFPVADFSRRAWQHFEQGRRGNIFDIVLAECNCHPSAEDIAAMISVYRRHDPIISLLPDAINFLTFCKDRFQMALITDGPAEAQRRKLKSLGVEQYFAVRVLTGERPGWSKPNVNAFRHVEERLGGQETHFCYIADNPQKDFHAPRCLGWTAIRIRREQGIYSALEAQSQAEPDCEIGDLGQLQSALSVALL